MEEVKAYCTRLGIEYSDEFAAFYQQGKALFAEKGYDILDLSRVAQLNEKYRIFRKYFDELPVAADLIRKNEDLTLFVYILYCMIEVKYDTLEKHTPEWNCMETDFAPLFSYLYGLDDMVERLESRKLPYDVISDTLHNLEAEMDDYVHITGRTGMRRYVSWYLRYRYCTILRIGRLNFEIASFAGDVRAYEKDGDIKLLMDDADMHVKGSKFGSVGQEDEAGKYHADITESGDTVTGYTMNYYGECIPEPVTLVGYREILRKGDPVISVHIPADDVFTTEVCEAAYERAVELFQVCYPDHPFNCFVCYSWMMEKRLRDIMQRETNITRFADRYAVFPMRSNAYGVQSFLFHQGTPVEPEKLPEDTSMQRAVKAYLCEGNYFFVKGGVRPKDTSLRPQIDPM